MNHSLRNMPILRGVAALSAAFASLGYASAGDAALGRPDVVATLSPATLSTTLTLDGNSIPLPIVAGHVQFETPDALCQPTLTEPCEMWLTEVVFLLQDYWVDVTINGNTSRVDVRQTLLSLTYPTRGENVGNADGYVFPPGALVHHSARFDGNVEGLDFGDQTYIWPERTRSPVKVHLSLLPQQQLLLEGEFDFEMALGDGETVPISLAFMGSATTPFYNAPPIPNAGPDQALTFGQTAFFSSDGTFDQNGDETIASYVWLLDSGEIISQEPTASVFLPAGRHRVRLIATDDQGGLAVDETYATVYPTDDPASCPPGSNVIVGTPNDDVLVGTAGADCILGLGGQDTITGGGGRDVMSGGEGDDTLTGGADTDVVHAGGGQDQVSGGGGIDVLNGGPGDDVLHGGEGNDDLVGESGQDLLYGGPGDDRFLGGPGDDQLFGDSGNDLLDGGENNDQCTGGEGYDTVLQCTPLDTPESYGPPAFPGDPAYQACDCRPSKCSDCSSSANACQGIAGCPQILECVQATASCNLPHECPACETGRSPAAIDAARTVASCFGGCDTVVSPPPPGFGGLAASVTVLSDWPAGYCVNLHVSNPAAVAASSWSVLLDLTGATVYDAWNGAFLADTGVTSVGPGFAWNSSIAPGATHSSVGFCANRDVQGSGVLPVVISASGSF